MNWNIFNEDCQDFVRSQNFIDLTKGKKLIVVTDPPFNVGYHYGKYKDKMPDDQYYGWLAQILESCGCPFVIVHYPEALYKLSFQMGLFPERVCSWVYNSNTARQHRDVAFFQVAPLFRQVLQPYKNPNDKRIMKRLAGGGRRDSDLRLVVLRPSEERIKRQVRPPVPNAPRDYEKYRWRSPEAETHRVRPLHGFGDDRASLQGVRD